MRYAWAPPFRQALEARLGAGSRAGGPSLARLRKEVAFDRLLARLVAVAPDRWILKGARALDYRFGDRALKITFDRRATHPLPPRLPGPPADWRVPYGRMCRDLGLDPDVSAGHVLAASLVDPVLAGPAEGCWDPARRGWRP